MNRWRCLCAILVVAVVSWGAVPVAAWAAVAVTFDSDWGSQGLGDGQFDGPVDVAVDKFGNVYVAGGGSLGDHRVQMFTSDGTFITSRGTTGVGSSDLDSPRCVTTDRWGNVYVGEWGNGGRIHTFGYALTDWNGVIDGSGPSAITDPRGIGVSLGGYLYLTDTFAGNIQRWTVYKTFMDAFTPVGSPTMGLGVSQDDKVYTTTDSSSGMTHSVAVYDPVWGTPTLTWGGYGTDPGQFDRPYDVETDPLGRAYVIESGGERGQVFTPQGAFLAQFGSSGGGDGQFWWPYGIAVGPGRSLYVADYANDRISKWTITAPTEVENVSGSNRIATAIAASKKAYPNGAPAVVIATGYNWPDALGGAALAGAVRGPILLTESGTLPQAVLTEIGRLGCERAYVLGGPSAVSVTVYDAVKASLASHDVVRLGGADRYETAARIARELKKVRGSSYDGTAFICTGNDFPDALAAAPIAAANGWPIYLTPTDHLPASVRSALLETWGGNPSNHGYIIGGEAAVGDAVETTLGTSPFFGFSRIFGSNRYTTAAKVAQTGYTGMGMLWSRPAIATGEDFPDALAGGVLQGSDASVLLLTPSDSLHPSAAAALKANKDMIWEIRFLGGTGAVSTDARNQVRTILSLAW
ncbi:MAG: hypothetical protein Kow0067_06680 [Coriobacteriia bacterium]